MFAVAGGSLLFDQTTKAAARLFLQPESSVALIPGFAYLRLSFNRGAAFGLLPSFGPLFIVIAIVAIYAIVRLRHAATTKSLSVGLGLLLGGAIGNLLDRLITPGRGVTDFIDLRLGQAATALSWPTFNIADAVLVIGVFITLLSAKVHLED